MNSPANRVYIAGPLTGIANADALKSFYERIGELCHRRGLAAYIPHKHTDPIVHPSIPPQEVYRRDMEQVSAAELVIAYIGLPSHGVGAEIERANLENIDVVLLYEEEATVSRLIRGCPAVAEELVFSSFTKALEQLGSFLDRWLACRQG